MVRRRDCEPRRRRSVLPLVLVLIAAALIVYVLTIYMQVKYVHGG
jgi:cell division septal protein FtsQ